MVASDMLSRFVVAALLGGPLPIKEAAARWQRQYRAGGLSDEAVRRVTQAPGAMRTGRAAYLGHLVRPEDAHTAEIGEVIRRAVGGSRRGLYVDKKVVADPWVRSGGTFRPNAERRLQRVARQKVLQAKSMGGLAPDTEHLGGAWIRQEMAQTPRDFPGFGGLAEAFKRRVRGTPHRLVTPPLYHGALGPHPYLMLRGGGRLRRVMTDIHGGNLGWVQRGGRQVPVAFDVGHTTPGAMMRERRSWARSLRPGGSTYQASAADAVKLLGSSSSVIGTSQARRLMSRLLRRSS